MSRAKYYCNYTFIYGVVNLGIGYLLYHILPRLSCIRAVLIVLRIDD